jgi:uncharacterized protein YndB with AHSA1/START domain
MAARAEISIAAPPEVVFDVLSEPENYAYWVVGSSEIHQSDDTWPAPGSFFEHSQGFKPVRLRDTTTVLESDRPRRLKLEARIRPFSIAEVDLRIASEGDGSRVTMIEQTTGGVARLAPGPVRDLAFKLRNLESLRRLRRLAEERAG